VETAKSVPSVVKNVTVPALSVRSWSVKAALVAGVTVPELENGVCWSIVPDAWAGPANSGTRAAPRANTEATRRIEADFRDKFTT